jgi:hypothetical protein
MYFVAIYYANRQNNVMVTTEMTVTNVGIFPDAAFLNWNPAPALNCQQDSIKTQHSTIPWNLIY